MDNCPCPHHPIKPVTPARTASRIAPNCGCPANRSIPGPSASSNTGRASTSATRSHIRPRNASSHAGSAAATSARTKNRSGVAWVRVNVALPISGWNMPCARSALTCKSQSRAGSNPNRRSTRKIIATPSGTSGSVAKIMSASRNSIGRPSCMAPSRSGAVLRTKSAVTNPCRPASITKSGSASGDRRRKRANSASASSSSTARAIDGGPISTSHRSRNVPSGSAAASASSSAQTVPAKAPSTSALLTLRFRAMPCSTNAAQSSASSWSGSGWAGGAECTPCIFSRATANVAARMLS